MNAQEGAIRALKNSGYDSSVQNDYARSTIACKVWKDGFTSVKIIGSDKLLFGASISEQIADALYECAANVDAQIQADHTSDVNKLRSELDKYKTAVKQLSFDLEMSKGAGKVNLATNVAAIRKLALEQAAEFVMDWGVPKDGHDLEELCKQITNLKETKALAINRALGAMDAFFNGGPGK